MLLVSQQLIDELQRTLTNPWFVARVSPSMLEHQARRLIQGAEFVPVQTIVVGVATHPQDDLILSAAVSGNADYLVTGDAEFRRVDEYQGVKIRTPAEFLAELDASQG